MAQIHLVPPSIWKGYVQTAYAGLPSRQRKLALAILTRFHSHHAGISPELALELATRLLDPDKAETSTSATSTGTVKALSLQRSSAIQVWDALQKRLSRTLSEVSGHSVDGDDASALTQVMTLDASLRYTVYRIALPLVLAGCRRAGVSTLFCEDEEVPTLQYTYGDYVSRLHDEMFYSILDEKDPYLPEMFWQDRVLSLVTLTERRTQREAETLPDTELTEAGVLLRLRPTLYYDRNEVKRRISQPTQHKIVDPRYPSAGIDGIRITRNLEELQRILHSELIYPDIMLYDRLYNTGFMATKRPPHPIELRDVLLVAICPHEVSDAPSGIFIKSCWLDFVKRFVHLLQETNRVKSEVRWVEGNTFDAIRTQAFIIRDMAIPIERLPNPDSPRYRYQFFNRSAWLPDYFDRRAAYRSLPQYTKPASGTPSEAFQKWSQDVWQSQREFGGWRHQPKDDGPWAYTTRTQGGAGPRGFEDSPIAMEQYRYVHLVMFLPAAWNVEQKVTTSANPLQYATELTWRASMPGVKALTVNYIPEQIDYPGWDWVSDYAAERHNLEHIHAQDVPSKAGALVSAWMDAATEGLQRVR